MDEKAVLTGFLEALKLFRDLDRTTLLRIRHSVPVCLAANER